MSDTATVSSESEFSGHAHVAAPPPSGVDVRHHWSRSEARALYELPL